MIILKIIILILQLILLYYQIRYDLNELSVLILLLGIINLLT